MTFKALDAPLRPLLFATGAAATAVGICFLIRRGYGVIQTGSLDALYARLTRYADETRDAQRDSETLKVLEQMDVTLSSVLQLKKEVLEMRRTCVWINRRRQKEQQACGILMAERDRTKDALKFQYKLLKVSRAESARQYRDVLDANVQLEDKILDLESQLNKVTDYALFLKDEFSKDQRLCQKTKKDLALAKNVHEHLIALYGSKEISLLRRLDSITAVAAETQRRYEQESRIEAQNQNSLSELSDVLSEQRQTWRQLEEQQNIAQRVKEELKTGIKEKEQTLKSIEANCPQMMRAIFQDFDKICSINCELRKDHETLKGQHSELLKKCEQEREAHNALKIQYEQMIKEYQEDRESSAVDTAQDLKHKFEREKENSDLRDDVAKLEETVFLLKQKLSETDLMCAFIKKERQHLWEACRIETSCCKETMKQCEELLREMEKERLAHRTLKMQYGEMMEALKQCTESLDMDHISQELEKIPAGGGV